jgi:hypothetical protein
MIHYFGPPALHKPQVTEVNADECHIGLSGPARRRLQNRLNQRKRRELWPQVGSVFPEVVFKSVADNNYFQAIGKSS